MIIYSIYKVVNSANGKVYIGFDSAWPARKKSHKYYLKHRDQAFYRALRKYGWNNFNWEVIYQSTDGYHCLNVMEPHFIKEYDSLIKGYNETKGGEGALGRKLSVETKKKMSESALGKHVGTKNGMYGKTHTNDVKSILSQQGKTKWNTGSREKLKATKSYGTFITPWGSFSSSTDAANHPKSTVKYYGTLRDYCINCDKARKKYLKNQTARACGFSFVPSEV